MGMKSVSTGVCVGVTPRLPLDTEVYLLDRDKVNKGRPER
jgi:hypothetical protein